MSTYQAQPVPAGSLEINSIIISYVKMQLEVNFLMSCSLDFIFDEGFASVIVRFLFFFFFHMRKKTD